MPNNLDSILELARRATPLPWKNEPDENFFDHDCQIIKGDTAFVCEFVTEANAAYIVAACNSLPALIAENRALRERVRELERQRELCQELLHDSWNQTEQCIDLLHDADVNLTKWACGVESCQGCDIPECDMGDLDMVEKYSSRKAIAQAAKEAVE